MNSNRLRLAGLLLFVSAALPLSGPGSWPVPQVAQAIPTVAGADTDPARRTEGQSGVLTDLNSTLPDQRGLTRPYETSADTDIMSDSNDPDPVGDSSRWIILLVLAMVLLGVGAFYLRRTAPVEE